ncbi:1-(5-phosphoribosyl)-5-amino-4-imidazole- carboxylate (AIR) carboxylase [Denitrovibrio acetiphilus DSM 12809]|uniref:1-(5-phosphoribosyl)-5-amino-4-imidazole-carboxylate (AIR) carboxylase n=1 Tax=Denitrovibrio acetiphilus (strain DSM 12809 / NBRC 114555 / N2460) TaxID=522772 RepID=D4H3N4_DENA2|nr:nickel pincer cofactor biosynthesis protein LarB [Denitrovibrio acetiphilus]ADD69136.1 1-(5-phosphoribosyl)-5-amino-4-imidazole- carboxylate (AIR) carboxylase [Denitrovibrio acetiphilus DSM 12809]
MNSKDVEKILKLVKSGEVDIASAASRISTHLDFSDVKPDTSRKERLGFDEVIYGRSKSIEQIENIALKYIENELNFVCTGLDSGKMDALLREFPHFQANRQAGILRHIISAAPRKEGKVAVITAGTSDIKVASEAAEILDICGIDADIHADIGVAGIHRFFSVREQISDAKVIIVIAGMEGALPSITGGMFPHPVIAVPTSTGYGAALEGFTALFSMLASCANGITVVNIDNGFGAAMAAVRIINALQEN